MGGPFLLIVAAVNGNLVECSYVPMLISRFVQRITDLFRLLLACSLVVPLVTDLFLACSTCYCLVPCFSNVDYEMSLTATVLALAETPISSVI